MLAKFDLKSPCIFVADISDISYEIMKYAYEISDDIRRKKIISFSRDDDKKRCAMAGLLVFWIMNCVLNFESDKGIYYEDSGKPYIQGGKIFFSVSHSKKWVAVIFSCYPVGVDIEEIKTVSQGVISKCTVSNEFKELLIMSEAERISEFIKLWTLKESYVKMTGRGLYDKFNEIEVKNNGGFYTIERSTENEQAFLLNTVFDSEYQISVCLKIDEKRFPEIRNIKIQSVKAEQMITDINNINN